MHIKVLKPQEGDEEASTLQKWVEQGARHSLTLQDMLQAAFAFCLLLVACAAHIAAIATPAAVSCNVCCRARMLRIVSCKLSVLRGRMFLQAPGLACSG